jgi:hypothetical protein
MFLPPGDGALASFILLAMFQGPFLATTFAMTLRGLGRHTKIVATGLTIALSGGGVWPSISWAVQRDHSGNDRYAMRVSVVIYAVLLVIVAVVNIHPTIRHWVEADRNTTAASEARQDLDLPVLARISSQEKRPQGPDALPHIAIAEHIEFARGDHRVA